MRVEELNLDHHRCGDWALRRHAALAAVVVPGVGGMVIESNQQSEEGVVK